MNQIEMNYHSQALEIAKRFHKAESDLIDILQKIDKEKIFLKLKYPSLFAYCLKELKLSESHTANFITVSRKATEIPELKLAISRGDITVSKARRITPVITKESQEHWLKLAKELPKQKLEKEVAKVSPQALFVEKANYVREDRLNLRLNISEVLFQKLRRIQDLESQRKSQNINLEKAIEAMAEVYLEKNDPLKKAQRAKDKLEKEGSCSKSQGHGHRMPLPAATKHQINLRDQNRCTHENCENSRWLEVHHVKPVSRGGDNSLENLRTLCWAHHKMEHLQ